MRRAVVTGPTGAVGRALTDRLIKENIKVYAICNPDGKKRPDCIEESLNLRIIPCGLSELRKLKEIIPLQVDAFFHLGWMGTVGSGRNDMDTQILNIQYTIDAVRVASELQASVFIGAGSQAEYGHYDGPLSSATPCVPESGYGMAKLCAGQMSREECRKLGLVHIWPRILSVYGPHDGSNSMIISTIQKLLWSEKPSFTAGEQVWDYLYAEDAAEALYRIALYGKDGRIYPLGSGQIKQLKDYITILRDSIDPELPLGIGDLPYSDRQVMHLEADISRLKADTGFVPETDFQTGIRKTIDWVKEYCHE
ncbi:MAG: NAD(P)-dependent oxidoreductase [Lachnospiraceae bacterium]|nr:NAD(P)-dependent oxidoreductase [Lachnospiraceae bacterium]